MKKFLVSSSMLLLPVLSFAQGAATPGAIGSLSQLLARIQQIINIIIPFLIAVAVFIIIYGIFGFITSAGDEEARAGAKQFIIWGIIGVLMMFSVWGLVGIAVRTFGFDNATIQNSVTGAGTAKNAGLSVPQLVTSPDNL